MLSPLWSKVDKSPNLNIASSYKYVWPIAAPHKHTQSAFRLIDQYSEHLYDINSSWINTIFECVYIANCNTLKSQTFNS